MNIPSTLIAEEILIRSGNIGSVRIAQKVGIDKFKLFLKKIGILDRIEFELEEIGTPLPIRWGKCKLTFSPTYWKWCSYFFQFEFNSIQDTYFL